jgi:uncharacterized protein YecE (DUF72 family)
MQWYAGTSGYSYKAWKGVFYPDDLPADQMLAYYAQQLSAVEINNTFYRMPRSSVLENWAAAVPEHFKFVIKASRRITHHHRLKQAEEPTGHLLNSLGALGDKLGAVLFQLPPNLRADRDRLAAFLDLLPDDLPAAFEFRHPSWDTAEIRSLLTERGVALCVAEDETSQVPQQLTTAPWLYLRLRKPDYTDQALTNWIRRGQSAGAERGYVFFKHEDEGAGPAMASRFLALTAARARKAPKATTNPPPVGAISRSRPSR